MKAKRILSIIFAVVFLAAVCVPASAAVSGDKWTSDDFTFTIPEEIKYVFTPETPAADPSWTIAGISDPSSSISDYGNMGVLADLYTEEGVTGGSVKLRKSTSDKVENIYTLRGMNDEELQSFLDAYFNSSDNETNIKGEMIEDIDGQPFYRVKIDFSSASGEAHEIIYGTIVNGYTLAFDVYSTKGEIEESVEKLARDMAHSVKFTNITEKPEPEPANIVFTVAALAVMALFIVAPAVYIPLRNKRVKKQKAKMAEMLSAYRKEHGDTLSGEAVYLNDTDCSNDAIHEFSIFHAYGKNFPSLITGAVVCVAALLAVFKFDLTWWVKALGAGISVYFVYRVVSMPNMVEKIQRKVFSRGVSQNAHYGFYEDGFRVSGIQSSSTFPYFQITAVCHRGHYTYLYYGPDNAYIVDDFGFTKGDYESFRKFIKEKSEKRK